MFTCSLLVYISIAIAGLEFFKEALQPHPILGGFVGIGLGILAFILAVMTESKLTK